MRIVLEESRCDGHGMCEAMAHQYFALDDDDQMSILEEHPPEADRALVHAAVQSCPALALTLVD